MQTEKPPWLTGQRPVRPPRPPYRPPPNSDLYGWWGEVTYIICPRCGQEILRSMKQSHINQHLYPYQPWWGTHRIVC